MKFVLSTFLLLMDITRSPQPNAWRGITPVRSTCEDVKKALKVDTCVLPISEYTIPDYRVMVSFANDDCNSSPHAWRVPKGTVLSLVISPQHAMTASQFGLDLTGFKKREGVEIVGLEHYDDDEEGVSVELFQGYLMNVSFGPRRGDDTLRCKPVNQAQDERTEPLCCGREASDPIEKAWQKFTAHGRYRIAAQSDMKWRDPKSRASTYALSSLGFDRHELGYYHFAAIVIDTKRNNPNRFGLVIFSAPRTRNGSYKPYWVMRGLDLSTSYLVEDVGLLDVVTENEAGSNSTCKIQWNSKNARYVCR